MCQNYSLTIPKRVEGIPDNAFWTGGIDGGAWYVIEGVDSINQTAFFQIYFDTSGELWLNRKLKLNCDDNDSINWTNLRAQINSFNGSIVSLNKSNTQNQGCFFE